MVARRETSILSFGPSEMQEFTPGVQVEVKSSSRKRKKARKVDIDAKQAVNYLSESNINIDTKQPKYVVGGPDWAYSDSSVINMFFNYISSLDLAIAKPYIRFRMFGPSIIGLDKLIFDYNETGMDGASGFGVTQKETSDSVWDEIGQEAYLLPQTLTRTNAYFSERSNYNRKFKPLFAIKDLEVEVVQAPAAIAFTEKITMTLTIFDRSKIKELSAMFNPEFGTKFLVEYGWAHPKTSDKDGIKDFYFFDTNKEEEDELVKEKFESIGDFIDSLRSEGLFILENFNINFVDGGKAEAKLELVSITSKSHLENISLIMFQFTNEMRAYTKLLKELKANKKKTKDVPSILKRESKIKSLENRMAFLGDMNEHTTNKRDEKEYEVEISTIRSVKEEINKFLEQSFTNDIGTYKFFKKLFTQEQINGKNNTNFLNLPYPKIKYNNVVEVCKVTGRDGNYKINVKQEIVTESSEYTYVSVLLKRFFDTASVKLQSSENEHTKGTNELDIIKNLNIRYFNFNNYCGNMSGHSIAAFIIKKLDFIDELTKVLANKPDSDLSLNDILTIIANLISDKKSVSYGMNKFFDQNNEELSGKYNGKNSFDTEYAAFIENHGGMFVMPSIRFVFYTETSEETKKTEYFLYIYDETKVEDEDRVFNYSNFEKIVNEGIIRGNNDQDPEKFNFEKTKQHIRNKSVIPYTFIDSERSVIKKIGLKTDSSSLMGSIYLEQHIDGNPVYGKNPLANQLNELPLEVVPAEISMDIAGMPKLIPHQKIFLDFKTGTDIDSIYSIDDIRHKIGPSSFETFLTLHPAQSYAKYKNATNIRDELIEPTSSSDVADKLKKNQYGASEVDILLLKLKIAVLSVIYNDFEKVFLIRHYKNKIDNEAGKKVKINKLLAKDEYVICTGVNRDSIEYYKLMALIELEGFKIRLNINNIIKKLEERSLTNEQRIQKNKIAKEEYCKQVDIFYSWFLTSIDKVNVRDKDIKKIEEEYNKGSDSNNSIYKIFEISGISPLIVDINNNSGIPKFEEREKVWLKENPTGAKILSYYVAKKNFDPLVDSLRENNVLINEFRDVIKKDSTLSNPDYVNSDNIQFPYLVYENEIQDDYYELGIKKLKNKYSKHMSRLVGALPDIFADFAPNIDQSVIRGNSANIYTIKVDGDTDGKTIKAINIENLTKRMKTYILTNVKKSSSLQIPIRAYNEENIIVVELFYDTETKEISQEQTFST